MNKLLFTNLSNQRALIRSGTAYEASRWIINIFLVLQAGSAVFFAALLLMAPGFAGGRFYDLPLSYRIMVIFGLISFLAVNYLAWAVAQAFFDIADASIALTVQEQTEVDPDLG